MTALPELESRNSKVTPTLVPPCTTRNRRHVYVYVCAREGMRMPGKQSDQLTRPAGAHPDIDSSEEPTATIVEVRLCIVAGSRRHDQVEGPTVHAADSNVADLLCATVRAESTKVILCRAARLTRVKERQIDRPRDARDLGR